MHEQPDSLINESENHFNTLLDLAVADIVEKELVEYDSGLLNHKPTEEDLKKEKALLAKYIKLRVSSPFTTYKRIAVIIILVLAATLLGTVSVNALRSWLMKIIRVEAEFNDKYSSFTFTEDFVSLNDILSRFEKALPGGYHADKIETETGYVRAAYTGYFKTTIVFEVDYKSGKVIDLNDEFEHETIEIEGLKVYTASYEGNNLVAWKDGSYIYVISSKIKSEALINIARKFIEE